METDPHVWESLRVRVISLPWDLVCSKAIGQKSYVTLRLPPRNVKHGGLESSGWRLISSIGKTKIIVFIFAKKNSYNFLDFLKKVSFWDFLDFFSGVGWTGELWSNCVFLILRNKEDFVFIFLLKIIFFKTFGFLKKCDFFLHFFLDFRFFLHIFKMLYLIFLMNSLEFLFRCFLDFLRFFLCMYF